MGDTPQGKFHTISGSRTPRVGLALQGGGTHGAFTSGALGPLLRHFEKNNIPVVGVCGDSAGAMNTLYASYGWITGQPGHKAETAEFMLERLWWSVDRMALMARKGMELTDMLHPMTAVSAIFKQAGNLINLPHDAREMMEMMHRHPTPAISTTQIPPLQQMVEQHIDFSRFMDPDAPAVMINTTNRHTGHPRLYLNSSLTPQAAAESGYLPQIMLKLFGRDHPSHHTHEHDGGFTANPPVMPLYDNSGMTDLIMIRITPLVRSRSPLMERDPDAAFADQQLRYLFNASVEAEMRDMKRISERESRPINVHVVSVPADWPHSMATQASLEHTNWGFFSELRRNGAMAATQWLAREEANLGVRSTYEVNGYEVFGHTPASLPQPQPQPQRAPLAKVQNG